MFHSVVVTAAGDLMTFGYAVRKKRGFWSRFYIKKPNTLPRQARDKHGQETWSEKDGGVLIYNSFSFYI